MSPASYRAAPPRGDLVKSTGLVLAQPQGWPPDRWAASSGLRPRLPAHTGERAADVFSRLLSERIIFLGSEIDDDVANVVGSVHPSRGRQHEPGDLALHGPAPPAGGHGRRSPPCRPRTQRSSSGRGDTTVADHLATTHDELATAITALRQEAETVLAGAVASLRRALTPHGVRASFCALAPRRRCHGAAP
ncbi:ATP-dependent Clp protease proteolytic subunit [Actinopolymorpha pittospori]